MNINKQKMIKNIYKRVSHIQGLIGPNRGGLFGFSQKPAPQQQKLQDWEYVQLISKEIKNNDINEALRYLIQSHLNNQILNKQIYYTVHQKLSEATMASGYHEILYKLYRQHFQPNAMTLGWMKKISKTQNPNLLSLLKNDYLKMDQEFPLSESLEQVNKSVENGQKQSSQEKSNTHGRKSRKVTNIPTTDQYFSKSPQQIYVTKRENVQSEIEQKIIKSSQTLNKQPTKAQIEIQSISHIQSILQSMFREYGHVTVHNIQLEFDHSHSSAGYDIDQEMNQMYDQNQHFDNQNHELQQQEGEQTMQDYVLELLSSVSKIKIGKVQFKDSKFLEAFQKEIERKNNDDDDDDSK